MARLDVAAQIVGVRRRSHALVSVAMRAGTGPVVAAGLTLHRNGGISLVGIPSIGGTTVAWGAVRRNMETAGAEPARSLGPVALFVGRDF